MDLKLIYIIQNICYKESRGLKIHIAWGLKDICDPKICLRIRISSFSWAD